MIRIGRPGEQGEATTLSSYEIGPLSSLSPIFYLKDS